MVESVYPVKTELFNATYGILFFGTPHKGLDMNNIASLLTLDSPRRDLIDSISQNAFQLTEQLRRFKEIVNNFKVVSYYEKLLTPQARAVSPHYFSKLED
jgi:hypothetical protein